MPNGPTPRTRAPPYVIALTGREKTFLRQYKFDYTLACIFDNLDGLFHDKIWPAYLDAFPIQRRIRTRDLESVKAIRRRVSLDLDQFTFTAYAPF